ncbi:unnamed protein product [Lepidochelys olivacea]
MMMKVQPGLASWKRQRSQSCFLIPNPLNVRMWDLLGIGIPGFRPDTYLQQVNSACYNFFIIVSHRFRSTHADLAGEIQRMGGKFYFVHSQVDMDFVTREGKRTSARRVPCRKSEMIASSSCGDKG